MSEIQSALKGHRMASSTLLFLPCAAPSGLLDSRNVSLGFARSSLTPGWHDRHTFGVSA